MNARLFDVLHDRSDDDMLAIGNSVDIHLDSGVEEPVEQNRRIIRHLNRIAHIAQQVFLSVDNLHRTTTQHVGRAHYQWVANIAGSSDCFINTAHSGVRGLQQIQFLNHLLEPLAIFRAIDLIRGGTNNRDTGRLERPGKF